MPLSMCANDRIMCKHSKIVLQYQEVYAFLFTTNVTEDVFASLLMLTLCMDIFLHSVYIRLSVYLSLPFKRTSLRTSLMFTMVTTHQHL
jgi:hypothetical protein